jgi:NitT/TauT family transport system substrate-binding protein
MQITRRHTLGLLSAGIGLGLAGRPAFSETKRSLKAHILGNSLAIHIPAIAALHDGLPALGYATSTLARVDSMQVMTQSIIGGSAEVGEADISSSLRASVAGANVRVIGLVYANADLVFVANADVVKDYADLAKPGTIVAVNSKGDWIHAMLVGPLKKRGIDINKLTIVEIGGSGSRMQALLAGRVQAVPVHIDQAPQIMSKGNYKILLKPWDEYPVYIAETWLVSGDWLQKPENQRMAIDLQKAVITSFRRANRDLGYFGDAYRKYCTLKGASKTTDDQLRPTWELMVKEIRAWPDDGMFKRKYFQELLPVYKAVGAYPKDPDLNTLIDTRYVNQALKELG